MADQATIRALTEALQGMKASSRKPELPEFDAKNVELWTKRVDNAYRRAGITDPKDKFAYIESKFPVNSDARVQAFIFGDGTQDEWDAFMGYLKDRYGKTKSQKAAVILDGVRRDGRLPSEMYAFIKEKIGDLTVDDIVKEMVLRELPTEIQRTIHEQSKSLDGTETTKLADGYFDKEGKPIHKSAPLPVNNVESNAERPNTDRPNTDEESQDVNAVERPRQRGRRFQPRANNPNSRTPWAAKANAQPRPPATQPQNGRPNLPITERRDNRTTNTLKDVKLCRLHLLYGDNARSCDASCAMYAKFSGKAQAGRQT